MKDLQNIFPEIDRHSQEGSQMQHDIEKDWGFLDSKEGLEKNKVPWTADGQKFRYSLNDSQKDGLKDVNLRAPLSNVLRAVESMFPSL